MSKLASAVDALQSQHHSHETHSTRRNHNKCLSLLAVAALRMHACTVYVAQLTTFCQLPPPQQ
jgi:hypothetical protein